MMPLTEVGDIPKSYSEHAVEADGVTNSDLEITLTDVVQTIWRGRILIASTCLLTVVCAIIYLHFAPARFTISLQMTPVPVATGQLDNNLGKLGDLSSLMGISLPGRRADGFQIYLKVLISPEVAAAMIKQKYLMRFVFRKEWDSQLQHWREPNGILHWVTSVISSSLGFPLQKWHAPDAARLTTYLRSRIDIDKDPDSAIATIEYSSRDPEFGSKFLSAVTSTADNILRQRALIRSTQYIEYLSKTLQRVTNTEQRQSLMRVLSQQEEMQMMASATPPFAAEPLGLPAISDGPTSPGATLLLGAAVLVGLFLGIVFSFFMRSAERRNGTTGGDDAPYAAHVFRFLRSRLKWPLDLGPGA